MIAVFLLSLFLIGFWIGATARYCHMFGFSEDLWINRLFLPALSLLVRFGLFIFVLGRGWL
jgi:hypothetical protein